MKLTLKQKVFSLKERFAVTSEEGGPVYEVEGRFLSIGHKLVIRDMDGNEAARIDQKVVSLTPKFHIRIPGRDEMELRGHITLFKSHYTLDTAEGEWDIRGDFMEHEYEMKAGHAVAATVTKKWFSWGDTYLLDAARDQDALTALCVMLAVDCVQQDADTAAASIASSNG